MPLVGTVPVGLQPHPWWGQEASGCVCRPVLSLSLDRSAGVSQLKQHAAPTFTLFGNGCALAGEECLTASQVWTVRRPLGPCPGASGSAAWAVHAPSLFGVRGQCRCICTQAI